MEYAFHVYNKLATDGASMALERLLALDFQRRSEKTRGAGLRSTQNPAELEKEDTPPVVVCVGSDLAIGDSLGPITGSMLKYKTQGLGVFIYGTLAAPVTAKEMKYMRTFLKETHGHSPVVAIDAAVGERGDVGLMKLSDRPLLPGAGANKKLGKIGNLSIMGIVAEKSLSNYALLNGTRLHLVYSMAEVISDAVAALLWNRDEKRSKNA